MKITSVTVFFFFFFLTVSFQKYLIAAKFNVLYQHLRSTLTMAFETHRKNEDFTGMGVKPAPRHLTYYCMLLILSSKPSF